MSPISLRGEYQKARILNSRLPVYLNNNNTAAAAAAAAAAATGLYNQSQMSYLLSVLRVT